ncbi:profilin [Elysia marginata]|uniref:Profilin n=1 Tax=Elysia marginata TaxID=1093978 RepID=A0AAV4IYI1_9GAST|nr:profilin [Elysia marginata]
MLELMTWSEIIESLQQEGNLKMAAVFDEKCQQLAGTDGAMLASDDAYSITRIMNNSPSTMIYGLFLGGTKFQCLTVDHNTLIGQGAGDVFVALRNRNLLICAVAGLSSTVSCLGVVRSFVGRLVAEGAPEASVPSLM